ncbi:biogenesis of lysosome-related organelles complex 1 subunit 4 isoform X2 [Pelodiscus sinensis]|uniref:biogenesis of lysosome-related organelles complex 1 subunit 4 isoform X2 n=1 Tax=Pelodiscus sinensis TaxID=13735 RepID=UPI003F6BD295
MEEEEVAEPPGAWLSGDSGNVSQSPSSASGIGEEGEPPELLLSRAAATYAAYVLPAGLDLCAQIESLDKSLDDLLTRVDEFVGMLDMIRSETSQVVNESVPQVHTKATEMRQIYRKIDKLEAFVKMVGNNVAVLEEQVTKAETDLGTFPNTFKKFLHTISVPPFLNADIPSIQSRFKTLRTSAPVGTLVIPRL